MAAGARAPRAAARRNPGGLASSRPGGVELGAARGPAVRQERHGS
jgi:hypothetical protein